MKSSYEENYKALQTINLEVDKLKEELDKLNESIDYIETKTYVFRKPLVKCCQFHNDSNLIGAYCRFKQISGGQV